MPSFLPLLPCLLCLHAGRAAVVAAPADAASRHRPGSAP